MEDLLIKQAIALPSSPEDSVSIEDTASASTDSASGKKFIDLLINIVLQITETLLDALTSTSKRLTIALDSATTPNNVEAAASISTTIPANQSSLAQSVDITPRKKHIMISYNRSCEEGCRRLRNKLKVNHPSSLELFIENLSSGIQIQSLDGCLRYANEFHRWHGQRNSQFLYCTSLYQSSV